MKGGEKDRKKANAGIGGRREAQKSGKEFLSSHQRLECTGQDVQEYLPRGVEGNQYFDGSY